MEEGNESVICRICQEPNGELLTPCRCKGTAKYVHRKCLDDWRRIKKKRYRTKAYHCEICLTPFRLQLVYPSFFGYMRNHWTLLEKIMYSSSFFSCLFSMMVSFNAYKRDTVKRKSNVNILSKTLEKSLQLEKKRRWGDLLRTVVEVIRTLPDSFLYGWPTKIKWVMLFCIITVVLGNAFLFKQWRERTREERVLPYEESYNKSMEELD